MRNAISTDLGNAVLHTCKTVQTLHEAQLSADTLDTLDNVALTALGLINDAALLHSNLVQHSTNALFPHPNIAARPKVLQKLLQRIKAAQKKTGAAQNLCVSLPYTNAVSCVDMIAILDACQKTHTPVDFTSHINALQQALESGWDDLAEALITFKGATHLSNTASWSGALDTIWKGQAAHRPTLLSCAMNLIDANPEHIAPIIKRAAQGKDALPLALILRRHPQAIAHTLDIDIPTTFSNFTISPTVAQILTKLRSAHGRMAVHAWDWDPQMLARHHHAQAERLVRAWIGLPTTREARKARKHARQVARGRKPA